MHRGALTLTPPPPRKSRTLTTDRVTGNDPNRSPQECGKLLVKRLVALPGDKVRRHTLPSVELTSYSNGSPSSALSDNDQVKTLPPYPDTEVVIPEGHGWLEGDAPFNSEDSNHFGPVRVVCPETAQ
jgi:type IV secretory pathway protease TraF